MKSFKNFLIVCSCLVLIACDSGQNKDAKRVLPEAESAGAKIFSKFCSNCHAPPRIKSHKADEWKNIVDRMQTHRLKKAYKLLTDEEKETLLLYLQKHSD